MVFALVICLAATILIVASAGYDPWVDYDEDGTVDYDDFIVLAGDYGTSGEPTKNVNVTNWPVGPAITVWYNQYLPKDGFLLSDYYKASGFGHLHMLAKADPMSSLSQVNIQIVTLIYNQDRTNSTSLDFHLFTLTISSSAESMTIPVPAEDFAFKVHNTPNDFTYVWLSFYLTWA